MSEVKEEKKKREVGTRVERRRERGKRAGKKLTEKKKRGQGKSIVQAAESTVSHFVFLYISFSFCYDFKDRSAIIFTNSYKCSSFLFLM